MPVRVAINGLGRIGRLVLRAVVESGRADVECVAINGTGPVEMNAHLLRHDSTHGAFPGTIRTGPDWIDVGRGPIPCTSERDPSRLDWGTHGVDVVLECTGKLKTGERARVHLDQGARRVLISAPAKGVDLTLVQGINEDLLRPEHRIVSCASCTTNCLAPVARVLDQVAGIRHGFMTTVHAFTSDQRLLDGSHADLRRARAATGSLVPASTGAAASIGEVLPGLAGKLDGVAVRVPVANVSMIDLTVELVRATDPDTIRQAMEQAAQSDRLRGILAVNTLPLVSCDFNHHPASAIFDATETRVVAGTLARVLAWYDNEWGFSNRMLDVAVGMHFPEDAPVTAGAAP